jgi:5'-3' exonuclease
MSSHGYQVGGVVGFIKTITQLVKQFSPNIVYIVWESGGSIRRRNLYSEYKKGSRPAKLNRFYGDDIPDTTNNKIKQIAILAKLLSYLPVCQIHVQDCEGDDVINHLTKKLKGKKIIVTR